MQIKISYLFSRNQLIGSKLISWASGLLVKDLEKVPSHVALLLEYSLAGEAFVAESVLDQGVRIVPYSIWLSKNEECYKIPCTDRPFRSEKEVYGLFKKMWNKKYDWPGILYFAWRFALHFAFKLPFPKKNRWQSESKFFCTEAVADLSGYTKADMTTPAKMCSDFLKGL